MTFSILIFLVFIIAICAVLSLRLKKVMVRRHDSEVGQDNITMSTNMKNKGYKPVNKEKKDDDANQNQNQNN